MARTESTTLDWPPAGRQATEAPKARRRVGLVGMAAPQGTPATIQALIALLVILALAWGGFAAWAVAQHSSAASSLAHEDAPTATTPSSSTWPSPTPT